MTSKNLRGSRTDDSASRLRLRFLPAWALMAVSAAMLGGCQLLPPGSPDATRFFVLAGPAVAEPTPSASTSVTRHLHIGLRQVELPAYLRVTKSMVVRNGANEIRYQDFSRWAEPLDAGVNRILKERLQASPGVSGVDAYPLRGDAARDLDIFVRVDRCEGATGENATARFAASYEIIATDGGGRVIASGTYVAPDTPWDGKDFAALAKQLSDGVSGLADKIAADLPK